MASIDRAYVDMAAHTLKGFESDEQKFNFRMKASILIKEQINNCNTKNQDEYDGWHENLCNDILKLSENLIFGQAQKWVNMAMKYLYLLFSLGKLHSNAELHQTIENNYKYFHIPLDNIIFKEIYDKFEDLREASCSLVNKNFKSTKGYKGDYPWSKIDIGKAKDYREFQKSITDNITDNKINWENKHWIKKSKELS